MTENYLIMSKFNNLIFLLLGLLSLNIFLDDFETPYPYSAGDLNTAEIKNLENQNLQDRLKTWSSIDLVGKWSCNLYTDDNNIWGSYAATFGAFEGIYKTSVPHVYTFKNDGDGTFSVESSINLGLIAGLGGSAKSFSLRGNVIFSSGTNAHFSPISKTRFLLSMQSVWIESSYRKSVEICDKTHQSSNPNAASDSGTWQVLPPKGYPTGFRASLNGTSLVLNWDDNTNETGFKIFRKDALTNANFNLITTTGANVTTYTDTIDDADGCKTYWYKVVPFNATGDGQPSKVIRIRYVTLFSDCN